MYYVLTENFFGIKKRGNLLYIQPCFPSVFSHLTAEAMIGGRKISIEYLRDEEEGVFIEGKKKEYVDLKEIADGTLVVCRFV